MSKEVLLLVDVLAKEKNLDKEVVFDSLEKALALATKKNFVNESPEIFVSIDRQTGKYKTIRKWLVTTDVDFYDDDKELSLSDVQSDPIKYGDAKVGDTIEEVIDNVDFGRVSAQAARNIIALRIKDAEREHILQEYLAKNRGIIIGRVKKNERGNIVLDCGRIEAFLMRNDIIPKEIFRIGDSVKAYLNKASPIIKNGRVLVSRVCNEFLLKLLENNIPEIANGRIEVVSIAREPGIRSKVVVYSLDSRIDVKGACIGFRNQRIDNISKELSNEKIDILLYDNNLAQYAINLLAPAEIKSVIIDEEKNNIEVIVDDEKLGNAIGIDGVNVKLASKIINMNINVMGLAESQKVHSTVHDDLIKMFSHTLDIDDDISEILVNNDFRTLEEVAYVDKNELLQIEDFDEDIVNELQNRAKNKLLSKTLIHKESMDNLAKELNNIAKFSKEVLLTLVEHNIKTINDFADLSGDELIELINIDEETANKLILKARELSGYFINE
jgi:N utilization substance protein A